MLPLYGLHLSCIYRWNYWVTQQGTISVSYKVADLVNWISIGWIDFHHFSVISVLGILICLLNCSHGYHITMCDKTIEGTID